MNIEIGDTTRKQMETLGISEYPFSLFDLKKFYRTQALLHHPDKGGNPDNFKRLKKAYDYLEPYAVYEDKEIKKLPQFQKLQPGYIWIDCKNCRGTGIKYQSAGSSIKTCLKCNGSGDVELVCKRCTDGWFITKSGQKVQCRTCSGSGVWKSVPCNICNTRELREQRRQMKQFMFGSWFNYDCDLPPKGKIRVEHKAGSTLCSDCNGTGEVQEKQLNPVLVSGTIKL